MNIKTFAQTVGISTYTLRYYEKAGLLREIPRNASGHRSYAPTDIDWVKFIVRLKETGMPLEGIKQYAELRALGDETLEQRQALLEQHRVNVIADLARKQHHLEALERKIAFYEEKSNP